MASGGRIVRDVQPNDVGQQNVPIRDELPAALAIDQFYSFAGRCMDWATTTRSFEERALYTQMGLQWLAAGARLQTFRQFNKLQSGFSSSVPSEGQAHLQGKEQGCGHDRSIRRAA